MAEPPFGHESSGVDARRILRVAGIGAAAVVVCVTVLLFILYQRVEPHRLSVQGRRGPVPPVPRLEVHPKADLASVRAQENSQLEGWRWTDATRQFAHIPIERAMAIYAQQHESNGGAGQPAKPGALQSER